MKLTLYAIKHTDYSGDVMFWKADPSDNICHGDLVKDDSTFFSSKVEAESELWYAESVYGSAGFEIVDASIEF